MYFPSFAKSFSASAVCDSPLSRKYCQYFRIGMKQDLLSKSLLISAAWLFSSKLFYTLRRKKNALVCVLKSLEWNQGKTMLDRWTNFFEKGPQRLFNLDSTAVWNCFKKKGLPMSLSENSVCSLNQI